MHALELTGPMLFLSTLSLRRATRLPTAFRTPHQRFLSTLSLRRATLHCTTYLNCSRFLSTLSLRRATTNRRTTVPNFRYFYPRSPCGERLHHRTHRQFSNHFYPRSPCGERLHTTTITICTASFLSTLSLRRATIAAHIYLHSHAISIHALLAESDSSSKIKSSFIVYFYPRSPCGERRGNCP